MAVCGGRGWTKMRFLSVADRELRSAARQKATYRTRWITAAVFFGLLVWLLWVFQGFTNRGAAPQIFKVFSVLTLLYCLFLAAGRTADCIGVERGEGTLGLLFLTNLNSAEIIAGKLCSSALASVYGLMAIFPMLALPLLMGGVTIGQFALTVLALLNGQTNGSIGVDSRHSDHRTNHCARIVAGLRAQNVIPGTPGRGGPLLFHLGVSGNDDTRSTGRSSPGSNHRRDLSERPVEPAAQGPDGGLEIQLHTAHPDPDPCATDAGLVDARLGGTVVGIAHEKFRVRADNFDRAFAGPTDFAVQPGLLPGR
jgi:hypothetical protein